MLQPSLFDGVPLVLFVLLIVAGILAAMELGYRIGRFRYRKSTIERPETVGTLVASALGLVAFLLAFTFSIAAHRFEAKRQTLHQEVNAVSTLYLRADFLPEPHRGEIKKHLREYVDARLIANQAGRLGEAIEKSEALHRRLWATALAATSGQPITPFTSLVFQSLNELIDLHTMRVIAGLQSRLPDPIWVVLLTVILISFVATGYHNGMTGACRTPLAPVVACLFAIVIGLIMDLERTQEGTLRVSYEPLQSLKSTMK